MQKKGFKQYRLFTVSALVSLTLLVSACSGGDSNTSSPSASPSTSPSASVSPSGSATGAASEAPVNNGKYDPPIKMTTINTEFGVNDKLPPGDTVEDNAWTRAYRDMLGIEVETLYSAASGGSAVDKLSLLIATNKTPDMFNVDPKTYEELVKAGRLADLTEAYEKYASPALREVYESDGGRIMNMAKRDGKLYGLPIGAGPTEDATMLLVRKDWLDKLGLPAPQTMDDLYRVAEAFTKNDPDGNGKPDTFGLGTYKEIFSWDASLTGFFNAFHAYPDNARGQMWINQGGKLIPGYKQPEVRAALLKLQELYKQGYMDPEWATKGGDKLVEDVTQSKIGMYFGGVWDADYRNGSLKKLDPTTEWLILPIPSVDGTPAKTGVPDSYIYTYKVVNGDYQHPEALIMAANLALELTQGPNADPATYRTTEQIWKMPLVVPAIEPDNGYKATLSVVDAIKSGDTSTLQPTAKIIYDRVTNWLNNQDVNDWGHDRIFGPENSSFMVVDHYVKNDLLQRNAFSGVETPAMRIYGNKLRDRAKEVITKVIMGEDIKSWDDFLGYWDKQGGLEMEAEATEWLNSQK